MTKLTDMSALEILDATLTKIEKTYTADERTGADDDSALAKLEATLTEIERSTPIDVLAKVRPSQIRELAQRLNVDPDGPNALAELRKIAGARPMFVESFLAEPMPAKTMGAGAAHAMSTEKIEAMAKARGFGMSEAEWKRGLA
jgi:hypothetical protein